jgi:SAM-dependent methyltransferase
VEPGQPALSADRSATHDPERSRRYWRKHADDYDAVIARFERILFAGGRRWACSRARGATLEVAAGTGRNLPHYPDGVDLTITDFSTDMLAIARRRVREAGADAEVRTADAGQLDFADASFDTVLCTLGLCSVPDDRRAIAEMARVLRPGGRLVLLEHVRSPNAVVRGVQRALDVLSSRLCCDHLTREPLDHVGAAGLEVEELERSKLGIVERLAARKRA